MEQIAIKGTFTKASTTIDGGWRVTFDFPDHEGQEIAKLLQLRDTAITVVIVPDENVSV